ncbi:MAG: DUF4175 family protein, partial [Pseudomonadota bacterium]
ASLDAGDAVGAMPALAARLMAEAGAGGLALVVLFVARAADWDRVAEAAGAAFGAVPVIGCSTAGEIGPGGYEEGTVVAIGLPRRDFAAAVRLLAPLAPLDTGAVAGAVLSARLEVATAAPDWGHAFAMLMVDGMSRAEDRLVAAIAPALGPVAMFGGSAGDGLEFRRSVVLQGGRAVAGAAAIAVVATLARGVIRFEWPGQGAAEARLDESAPDGDTAPLAVLTDAQASGRLDPFSRAIWLEHRRRAERAARALTVRPANLRLSTADPWALRLFAPVLLLGGLLAAGGDWAARLTTLVVPPVPAAEEGAPPPRIARAEAWVTPPAYTGVDAVYLDRDTASYRLPVGSSVTVRVTDLDGEALVDAPGLSIGATAGIPDAPAPEETVQETAEETADGGDAERVPEGDPEGGDTLAVDTTLPMAPLGAGLHELRATLSAGGRLTVIGGGETLGEWEISVIPDARPSITLEGGPRATFAGGTEVDFRATDDYGVAAAYARVVPEGGLRPEGETLVTEALEFALPLPISGDPRDVTDTALEDVSEHPMAGGMVELTLHAEDGAGQTGASETVTVELPGRRFTNRLARALVEQRRDLAMDFGEARRVLDMVQAVTVRPQEVFGEKHGAYLAVRSAVRRLAVAVTDETVADVAQEVTDLLWEAAIDLEGGDIDSALERLRAAEQALQDALENGTEEDIRRAMEEMRAAMEQYLQEFARQQMQQMQPGQQQQQQGQQLTQQDLNALLDEMQRRAESGLRDQARDMLSQLRQMLENLQMGQPQMGQQGSPGEQAMEQLQELIQRQRDLSDRFPLRMPVAEQFCIIAHRELDDEIDVLAADPVA